MPIFEGMNYLRQEEPEKNRILDQLMIILS